MDVGNDVAISSHDVLAMGPFAMTD
jgi:hypothetical protein